ncbi:MAG: hypothetical protein K2X48_18505 [Chitinophagaceae bacterium]|nr:hypothetical protein [Chitinophagaceae bacterium]
MNINRHNYEEFFLLYVDHELTAAERMMVETFAADNPDLKEELELLQQSTFTADTKLDEIFKNSLLQPVEETIITEEQLLLYVDDELSLREKDTVSNAMASSPELQKQMQWLQRSKLSADTSIVFPDKSLLYKEAQPARVLYMSTAVRRWSAAAAVILMLGIGYWFVNRNSHADPVVKIKPTPAKADAPKTNKNTETIVPPVQNNELVQQQATEENNSAPVVKQKPAVVVPAVEQKKNNTEVAVQNNNQKQTQQPLVQQQDKQTTVDPNITAKTDAAPKINPDNESNNPNTSSVPIETSTAKTQASYASYTAADGGSEDENNLLNEERQRSSGLKGLFKKVKRTLERRTGIQSGDSQVRFAVFAVNTQ